MEQTKNLSLWTEEGYSLFASEGMDGIQVERLSRILQLNKSGFYHYFGDMEGFYAELVKLHHKKIGEFLRRVGEIKKPAPEYLQLIIENTPSVMFQVQLKRNKCHYAFYEAGEQVDRELDLAMHQLWCDFLGISRGGDLASRYFFIVRDMFYARMSFQNLNYPFLLDLALEAKQLVAQFIQRRALQDNNPPQQAVDDAV